MRKKEKHIGLSRDKIKELAEKEKVSVQTIYAALRFETNSSLAVKIRAMALQPERGGIVYMREGNSQRNSDVPVGKAPG